MSAATVSAKGQVTIPTEVREALDIREGDELTFFIGLDGRLNVHVSRPRVGAGRGSIDGKGVSVTRDEIGQAVADGVADRLERVTGAWRDR